MTTIKKIENSHVDEAAAGVFEMVWHEQMSDIGSIKITKGLLCRPAVGRMTDGAL